VPSQAQHGSERKSVHAQARAEPQNMKKMGNVNSWSQNNEDKWLKGPHRLRASLPSHRVARVGLAMLVAFVCRGRPPEGVYGQGRPAAEAKQRCRGAARRLGEQLRTEAPRLHHWKQRAGKPHVIWGEEGGGGGVSDWKGERDRRQAENEREGHNANMTTRWQEGSIKNVAVRVHLMRKRSVPSMRSSLSTLPRRLLSTPYRLPSCELLHCRSHLKQQK